MNWCKIENCQCPYATTEEGSAQMYNIFCIFPPDSNITIEDFHKKWIAKLKKEAPEMLKRN